ncbi:DUF2388 domain-containing protein [Pseudomonas sp. ZM23]|uniref:DUF2388 domain-containing protein n=1 Tax=Pseudomonas triclosanedens TaxID=2961893 RepID=A0ABY6ZYJ9_9PSED|nr:DUF2388 domain-containing protein [Pseudomonas triclosanedens]MCP8462865.1 DUF2388 domain-containing protein [Pseudomonas triclosanedens]MCP8468485.1 DUF2388 domain-containing protein [Pseudomonas triclosanedens]MCP8475207.1 DUF2388 domain-containing protein [Pseudomonas triclosanedens]WAI50044.1 DUF2388 domain-containing protein [Pseudomonas triclosanedens]
MRRRFTPVVIALTLLPLASAFAEDRSFWRGVLTSGATTASTYLTSRDDHKLVGPAQDDAASFIASDGAIRGPYLEAALLKLRNADPALANTSDSELASAILAAQH